jgi:hypothetical protein
MKGDPVMPGGSSMNKPTCPYPMGIWTRRRLTSQTASLMFQGKVLVNGNHGEGQLQ